MSTLTEVAGDSPVVRALPDFEAFYKREYRSVAALALSLTKDRRIAEDLAQDGFVAAYKRWGEVGLMDHPGAWVRRVVVNQSISRFRRLTAEAKALRRGHVSQAENELSADTIAVWDAIRRLPRRQAEVVVLTYYSGLTHAETAAVMGCGVETARTHLQRAKARLSELLGERE